MRSDGARMIPLLVLALLTSYGSHGAAETPVTSGKVAQDDSPARRPRARDLGVPFEGMPGPLNAITAVAAVEVGHATLISGNGRLAVGKGPVRTGVTAVWPRGHNSPDPVFGAWFALNGNGEMTGTTWVEESGALDGPVMITNTTANREAAKSRSKSSLEMLPNGRLNGLFAATVQATEEAIVNAMVAAETMTGANGVTVYALPHDRVREVLRKYNRH